MPPDSRQARTVPPSVSFKDVAADFYEDGILLSEVAFGEGHMDLPQVAAMMQKNDPRMLFQLEMITRVPHPPPHRLNR